VEVELRALWASCLGVPKEQIGVDSSLFDLGADSLGVLRMATMLGKRGWRMTPMQLRKLQTIARVAEYVATLSPDVASAPALLPLATIDPASLSDDLAAHHIALADVDAVIPATPFQSSSTPRRTQARSCRPCASQSRGPSTSGTSSQPSTPCGSATPSCAPSSSSQTRTVFCR
jgi:acyl carrier protein